MEVSLREFLETGRLGRLHVGVTREQVVDLLGSPEEAGGTSRKHRRPSIFRYGSLDVSFDTSPPYLCHLLHIEARDEVREFRFPGRFTSIRWELPPYTQRAVAEDYLREKRLAYSISYPVSEGCAVLTLPVSGVVIAFDEKDRLSALSTARGPTEPAVKGLG